MKFESFLERYHFEKYVLDVCIATLEQGGVTSKLDTYQFLLPIEAWAIPKYPDRTVILPPDADLQREITAFIASNEACLKYSDSWLGTWIEPDTRNCYLDVSTLCFCLDDALQAAMALSQQARRKIVALYDFKRGQAIYL
ncbi:hypothetical protein [Dictyobacter arantiisoli]|uniref:Uncharacterized protein n=1 Tax=Dictyobacter arantiisoli TaxID=2014874 RepID=A0A5A5TFA9_9CHLR|nr:hypothetical protein [Dictyobacter arantiisoli]GCF10260.1 hypothetical protein KDI_38240 [Dictyobacter arantiisoli]